VRSRKVDPCLVVWDKKREGLTQNCRFFGYREPKSAAEALSKWNRQKQSST
jgi:hypothetical protein